MGKDFEKKYKTRKQEHFTALKSSYETLIEAAQDKNYASRYYAKTLFGSILAWRNDSPYFNRIVALVVHFSKLNPLNVMSPLIESLPKIKSEAYDSLSLFDNDDSSDLYFLELSDTELIDHFAQFSAALDLSKEFSPKEEELGEVKDSKKNKLHRFTRNQQLLALYYTLKSAGIEPRKTTDMTNYTRFVHLLGGVDFSKVENDIFYSKVQKLPNLSKGHYLQKDLRYIRKYFLEIDAHSIVEEIDLEIRNCAKNT